MSTYLRFVTLVEISFRNHAIAFHFEKLCSREIELFILLSKQNAVRKPELQPVAEQWFAASR